MTTPSGGCDGSLAQTGSALTRVEHDFEEMGIAEVFSLLVSLFFVEFIE